VLPPDASVPFYACYIYSPRGYGPVAECSRLLRTRLKDTAPMWLAKYAARVREQAERAQFPGLFAGNAVLIPVPRSAPSAHVASWAAACLANELRRCALGSAVRMALCRTRAVRKSATALEGTRPTVQEHYESLAVAACPLPYDNIVLVDDVITKGRTLLAAAIRVREAFPGAQVRAFALVRTMGLVPDIGRLLAPCKGVISWVGNDAHRDP
jgi:predicted amidophosphoribosyltransferase